MAQKSGGKKSGTGGKLRLSSEMEMTLKRMQESKNVVGVVVVNSEGMPVMSSLDSTLTVQVSKFSLLC